MHNLHHGIAYHLYIEGMVVLMVAVSMVTLTRRDQSNMGAIYCTHHTWYPGYGIKAIPHFQPLCVLCRKMNIIPSASIQCT
ncbi:hypothetical protein FKM82_027113 [Ascaphus truei]